MTGKGGLPPILAGDVVRALGLALQPRNGLCTHPLDRVGIEARRTEREAEQAERLVLVLLERPQGAAHGVAGGLEREIDRLAFQLVLESRAVEFTGAFIEQIDREVGSAGLVGRVLVGTAAEGKIDGDQRHRGVAHQPDFDATRCHHAFDGGGIGGRSGGRDQRGSDQRQRGGAAGVSNERRHSDAHERFSPGRASLMRYPVTEWRLSSN